jgi:endoglucanase
VIGADLRNELRSHAQWGGTDPKLDWHAAAERAGNAVLKVNPDLLIIVEGTWYATDFREALENPVKLDVAGRLVYSPHDYAVTHRNGLNSYEEMKRALDLKWGFMLNAEPAIPIWVGEFGTCQNRDKCGAPWFPWFVRYLQENDLGWCYWPINGTQSSGRTRTYGAWENYGLLDKDYRHIASPQVLKELKSAGLNPR